MNKTELQNKPVGRDLKKPVSEELLQLLHDKLSYGNGKDLSEKAGICYQVIGAVKKTGMATTATINKLEKVLKAA